MKKLIIVKLFGGLASKLYKLYLAETIRAHLDYDDVVICLDSHDAHGEDFKVQGGLRMAQRSEKALLVCGDFLNRCLRRLRSTRTTLNSRLATFVFLDITRYRFDTRKLEELRVRACGRRVVLCGESGLETDILNRDVISRFQIESGALGEKYLKLVDRVIQNIENVVVLHIRRGDMAFSEPTKAFHGVVDIDYFTDCLRDLKATFNVKSPELYICTDSPTFVAAEIKDNPLLKEAVIITDTNRYEDFCLIRSAKYKILSNSGFGILAAWSNEVLSSTVCYLPKSLVKDEALSARMLEGISWARHVANRGY